MFTRLLPRAALLAALLLPLVGHGQDSLAVIDPWVREAPPTAKVLAAYMELHNPGSSVRTVTGADAAGFGRVELHRTEIHGDMAHMVRVPRLEIPAGGRIALAPGGYHLMLMDPAHVPAAGTLVTIHLELDNGEHLAVQAPVRRDGPHAQHGSHHHHH